MPLVYHCPECRIRTCLKGGEYPEECPSLAKITIEEAIETTRHDEYARQVMYVASKIHRDEQGVVRNRIQETIALCKGMQLKKVGVAFCIALGKEARVVCKNLSDSGLMVVPVCCKVGRVGLFDLGVENAPASKTGACNPIAQADLMNENQTELNIIMGLCVGHDILFTKYSKSPVTTLVVKDRANHHNPIAAMQVSAEISDQNE